MLEENLEALDQQARYFRRPLIRPGSGQSHTAVQTEGLEAKRVRLDLLVNPQHLVRSAQIAVQCRKMVTPILLTERYMPSRVYPAFRAGRGLALISWLSVRSSLPATQ